MAEKVRPVLILSVPYSHTDRALFTVVFHSTALRGSDFEVAVDVPFLKEGAFIVQSLATYPGVRAVRKLGDLPKTEFERVQAGVFKWLGK